MLTHPEPTHPPTPSVPGPSKLSLRIGRPPTQPVDPDWPTQPPFPTGPGPQWSRTDPGMPRPTDPFPPLPPPTPRVRVLTALGRYALAWGVVGWSVFWIADVHLFVPGLLIAAMLANPWRHKRPPRPAWAGSGMGVTTSLLLRETGAARRGSLSAHFPGR